MSTSTNCPVCDGALRSLDLPNYNLYRCDTCQELVQQLADKTLVPIGQLLVRHGLGDDRVRAAISAPNVNSVRSFLDVFEMAHRMLELNLAEAKGGLRTLLAQMENRMDFAISRLTGMDLASDEVGEALEAMREARSLASILPGRSRGVAQKGDDADKS
jgi:hypothetical protein